MNTRELLTELEEGVVNFLDSKRWIDYLKFASKFHNYSFANVWMIRHQMPEATRVAGFHDWKKVKRFVRKGQHGIRILAPHFRKNADDEDVLSGFHLTSVFDVSQTGGEELPSIVKSIEGDEQEHILAGLVELAESKGLEVNYEKLGSFGYLSARDKIGLAEGHDVNQAAQTMAHELAHWYLAHLGSDIPQDQAEFEAESAAFVVSNYFGFDTTQITVGYLASWTRDKQKVHAMILTSGKRIMKASKQIIKDMENMNGKTSAQVGGDC
jgi:hypothetical protein